jgi:hypothetical protein
MKITSFVTLLFLCFSTLAQERFGEDLYWFQNYFETHFNSSISQSDHIIYPGHRMSFHLDKKNAPWGGNYFAMKNGGIAYRWQKGVSSHIDTQINPISATSDEINKLSPIEKYDIYVGNYNFDATKIELQKRGPLRELAPQNWEGFCNGMRCAGILLPEPKKPLVVKNKEGIEIKFEPADLKALAAASYFYVENYAQIGAPTQQGEALGKNQPDPAVFDLVLRRYLKSNKKAFIIDGNIGPEIWNETVVGFDRFVSDTMTLSEDEKKKFKAATKKVKVDIRLRILGEIDIEKSNSPTQQSIANNRFTKTMPVQYEIFLTNENKMLGGKWNNSGSLNGVDMVWFGSGVGTDQHSGGNKQLRFDIISQLFKASEKESKSCSKLF